MALVTVVIVLMIVGVLLWIINTYIPMDGKIKKTINAVVFICVLIWLLSLFFPGFFSHVNAIRVPHTR